MIKVAVDAMGGDYAPAEMVAGAVPFFGGIGGASRNGILIKGSNYMDALAKVGTVVFDKTLFV